MIRAALADLDAYPEPLLAVLTSIDPKADGAFDLLRPVLFAAVIIGSRRPPPFASGEAGRRIQADHARAEKSGKDAERRKALIGAIQAHAAAEKLVLSTSEKFAESIRAGVRERLPAQTKTSLCRLCAQADPNITHSFYEFFAGSGMARVGLGPVNWRCAFANNFDHKKGQSYRANFGANDLRVADVAALQWVDDIHR